MSDVVGKKFYNAEQPSGNFKLLAAGASIALGTQTTGNDVLAEQEGLVVGTGGASTPTGFILQGGNNSISITATYPKVTVV